MLTQPTLVPGFHETASRLARALADWFSLAAHGAQFTYGSECIVGDSDGANVPAPDMERDAFILDTLRAKSACH
jgi:hypothetical protein